MSAEQPRQHERVFEPLHQRGDRGARRYDPVTVADLKAMADLHSDDYPVISLYLDVRPGDRQGDKVRTKLKHLIGEVERLPATRSKERRRAFQQEAERLLAWFEGGMMAPAAGWRSSLPANTGCGAASACQSRYTTG